MSLRFTQEEIERELSDILTHGDRVDVARISGLSESYIKRQFNPDDETASCAFRILQVVCALDELGRPDGERFWQALSKFRELSKPRKSPALNLNTKTGQLGKEVMEFTAVRLENLPFVRQMAELLDVRKKLDEVQEDLIAEFNASKDREPEPRKVNFRRVGM